MRTSSIVLGCVGLFCSAVLVAADPPYVGLWRVNEEKSDRGPAFTFTTEAGALRLIEGDRSYIVRFDGKEYPHPLGGLVRWIRIDDRSWETAYTQDGKLLGNAIYRLSDDGQTLTVRQKNGTESPVVYRRTSGERQGLAGVWSLKTASVSTMGIEVADGYDLVQSSGGAKCKANFDGRDYPIIAPNGQPSGFERCRISKVGERGFSLTISINAKPVAIDTYTVSEDGHTLTDVGGSKGQPHTIVHERR
jgi:hypothetical protein